MGLVNTTCVNYNVIFLKERKRVNEAIKLRWKIFCSTACKNSSRSTKLLLICKNSGCQKEFQRVAGHVKDLNTIYCSRSCAATVNNKKFPKRKIPDKTCPTCKTVFHSYINLKYCSLKCLHNSQLIDKDTIINEIKQFYAIQKKIPFRNEFHLATSARKHFGTWNKAIEEAGFVPNKLKFTRSSRWTYV